MSEEILLYPHETLIHGKNDKELLMVDLGNNEWWVGNVRTRRTALQTYFPNIPSIGMCVTFNDMAYARYTHHHPTTGVCFYYGYVRYHEDYPSNDD